VLIFTYAHVFQVFCRNATTAIKTNHITVPKITLLYINFTPFLFASSFDIPFILQSI